MLKARFLAAISEGLWVLMGLIFYVAWCSGLVIFVWQLFKRRVPNWFAMWRAGIELGPIEMAPSVTPKMQREALFFTVALLTLAAFAAVAAVLRWTVAKIGAGTTSKPPLSGRFSSGSPYRQSQSPLLPTKEMDWKKPTKAVKSEPRLIAPSAAKKTNLAES
jgi:hypothetical protein